ncbi:MAG: AAA family ATPase [Zavarzinella sp.]
MHIHDQLKLLVRSGYSLISIETRDEVHATELIRELATELYLPLFEWTVTTGLARTKPSIAAPGIKPGKTVEALDYVLGSKDERELYLFKDLGAFCSEPFISRQVRDVMTKKNVHLFLLDSTPLPESIRRLTIPVQIPLPDSKELENIVKKTYRNIRDTSLMEIKATITTQDLEQIVQTLRGLTGAEAARVVANAVHFDNSLTPDDLPRIVEAKRNLLQSSGCLESVNVNVKTHEVGGLTNLKNWLQRRRGGFSREAIDFGLDPPRGMLLLGVQGCGKSLCAKVVAADWQMPLLRMDPGVLYQKFIGESENRLREALQQAESMAPAVLWIDEIEKAFASASSDSADGGLSQRMFGTLLSWMQDHRSPIFMVATANNIAALPPELMRKGRFDEVFFVDLPTDQAREQIISIHLQRRKRSPAQLHLPELVAATQGFSGAEIEQAVISGLYAAFQEQSELTTEHLLQEIRQTRPLSVLMGEKISQLRAWATNRCVPADG